MKTGMELCLAAQDRLEAAGVADAPRDASLLFFHALEQVLGDQVQRHHMAAHLSEVALPEVAARFAHLIEARAARQPVAQIVGRRAFWMHEFEVTRDTLDPRPDTETLVEVALAGKFSRVLDLGTGTGAILISLLAERREASGVGVDLSPAALEVARRNAARVGVDAQFIQSDWFQGVTGEFDLIVSNPPYIAAAEMAALSPEVRDWEPRLALTDEGDGLAAYRAIAAGAGAHLAPGGRILFEIGPTQAADVQTILAKTGFSRLSLHQDLDGRDRVIMAQRP